MSQKGRVVGQLARASQLAVSVAEQGRQWGKLQQAISLSLVAALLGWYRMDPLLYEY